MKLVISVSLLTWLQLFGFVGQYMCVCVLVHDSVALKTQIEPESLTEPAGRGEKME